MIRGLFLIVALFALTSASAQVRYGTPAGIGAASGIGAAGAVTTLPPIRNDDYLRAAPSVSAPPPPPPVETFHVPHVHAHECRWVKPCETCSAICVDN